MGEGGAQGAGINTVSLLLRQLSEPAPPLVDTTTGCTMTTSTLPLLPPDTARWRIEKLPLAEIKERLQAAGLECNGTKRTLAQRLHDYLGTQPPRADASASEDSNQQSTSEASDSETDGSPAADQQRSRRSRSRRRRRSALSTRDIRAVRELLRHRPRGRGRASSPSSEPRSPSSRSSSSSTVSSSPSPRRSRSRSRRRSSRTARTISRSRDHRRRGRRGRHHSTRTHRRRTGNLPPIPDRLTGRIKRGEYIDLTHLLHANLTKARGRKRDRAETDARRVAAIGDFESWLEAWSVYAAVLASFYPHLAPRLFSYQHFLTLKSRAFQTRAWLRYDTEFRLKLAANASWHFETVDTELWASCFAADGLASAQAQQASLACFVCGSTTHLYAACPQRRPPANRHLMSLRQTQPRPLATTSGDLPANPSGEPQEPCLIFNDKGRCFRGSRCPYSHTCTHCGGQHSKRGCPNLRAQ